LTLFFIVFIYNNIVTIYQKNPMFRVLFFILILSLSLYGIIGFLSPLKHIDKEKLNQSYLSYLSGALQRNTWEWKTYDVVFEKSNFDDSSDFHSNRSQENDLNTSYNIVEKKDSSFQNTTHIYSWIIPNTRPNTSGNFGTPDVESQLPSQNINSDCSNGLIFDPCLMLSESEPASGWMYFGSDRT
jgi:hypothetical protein